MTQRFGNLQTSKTWQESLWDLREEFRKWGIEDYLLPTKKQSELAGKVSVSFALKGTWVNPECGRWPCNRQMAPTPF